jgi:hypothetical protein
MFSTLETLAHLHTHAKEKQGDGSLRSFVHTYTTKTHLANEFGVTKDAAEFFDSFLQVDRLRQGELNVRNQHKGCGDSSAVDSLIGEAGEL